MGCCDGYGSKKISVGDDRLNEARNYKQDFLAWIFGGGILLMLLSGMFPVIENFVVWILVPVVVFVALGTALLRWAFGRIVG